MNRVMQILFIFSCCAVLPVKAQQSNCQQIETVLSEFVYSQVSADSINLQIQMPQNIPQSAIQSVRVDWKRSRLDLIGQVTVPVQVSLADSRNQNMYVRAEIRTFDQVVVCPTNLARHEILQSQNLARMMRETTSLKGDFFRSPSDVLGKRVRRYLIRDRIILADMVESPPLILRGEPVEVVVKHGNLSVTSKGFARQDGWQGDVIRVRLVSDRKEMKATVISEGQVAIAQ